MNIQQELVLYIGGPRGLEYDTIQDDSGLVMFKEHYQNETKKSPWITMTLERFKERYLIPGFVEVSRTKLTKVS